MYLGSHGSLYQKTKRQRGGRLFLDEEAALSEEEGVSSDEEDGYHLNRSLEGFVVDNSNLSQGLNGSLISLTRPR